MDTLFESYYIICRSFCQSGEGPDYIHCSLIFTYTYKHADVNDSEVKQVDCDIHEHRFGF